MRLIERLLALDGAIEIGGRILERLVETRAQTVGLRRIGIRFQIGVRLFHLMLFHVVAHAVVAVAGIEDGDKVLHASIFHAAIR